MGSKIIGDNIYLFAEKGIKLEAAAFHQEKIVTISEQGIRVGFSSGGGKHSVDAEFFSKEEKTRFTNTFYDASELIARNNLVLETPELLEVISSKMQFTKAVIKARGLHMHTHSNQTQFESVTTSVSTGLHFGIQENISSTAKTVGHVLNKTGVHWLDIVDRALNGYEAIEGIRDISEDIDKLSLLSKDPQNNSSILQNLKSVKYGAWASISASTSHTQSHKTQSVDNQLMGGDIYFNIEEDAIIKGIKCDLGNFSLKARNAYISTSSDTSNQETYSSNINIIVPISGSVGSDISTGFKTSSSESISYHDDNIVNIKGKLELKLAGNGVISGVQFIADEVDIEADNLLVETLQDVLKARMQGMNMSFGTTNQNTSTFGVKADIGKQDKVWSNALGSIIGRNVVNVTVQQTLEIVGGLIANAETNEDGSLTDKGRANVKAGKIIARKLYDYDDGYSYGLGVSLSKTVDPKTGDVKYGTKVPVKYSFNEKSRDILPTIGRGNLDVDAIEGSLNRDINRHVGEIYGEKASLDGKLPVSDMWNALKPSRGLSAGEQPDSKMQEKDSQKHNREVIDLSPDSVFLKKLLSTFEQDQDSEVAKMLEGIKEKQDSQETVPIYDVSNKTPIAVKPKITVGYVFNELFGIQSAQAAHPIAIGTGKALMYGSGMLLGAIAGNMAVEDYKNYQLFSNYSRDYTPYDPEGSYLPALTGNLMLSGANAGLFANPIDQMRFDGTIPEVGTQTTRNNIVANKGRTMTVMDTETSDLLRNIDANLDRPNITGFSTHYQPRSILFTPDSRDSLAELSRLPGFSPSMVDTWQESFPDDRSTLNDFGKLGGFTPDTWKILQEAFPVHEQNWKDYILLRGKSDEQIVKELTDDTIIDLLGKLPEIEGGQVNHTGLKLQEAFEQMYNEPKHENTVIAGVGSKRSIDDIERIIQTYGGTKEDWVKLSSKQVKFDHGKLIPTRTIKLELHWYENIKTGEKVEAKTKIRNDKWGGE